MSHSDSAKTVNWYEPMKGMKYYMHWECKNNNKYKLTLTCLTKYLDENV